MGMATYYLKAAYETEQGAARAHEAFIELCRQGTEAASWWQDHRHEEPRTFWAAFTSRFPVVSECLVISGIQTEGDCNNTLAGKLNFPDIDGDEATMSTNDTVLYAQGYVWHFADWDILTTWLKVKTGAVAAGWLSDEYANDLYSQISMD